MPNRRIIDFAVLGDAGDSDLLLVSSNDTTYCITVGTFKDTLRMYADEALSAVSNGLTYKGYVNYYKDLPSSNNKLGDVYTVRYQGASGTETDGTGYVWSTGGSKASWISLGPSITQKMNKILNGTYRNIAVVGRDGDVIDGGIAINSIATSNMIGASGGIASLDTKGKVPSTQLPALGLLPQIIVTADIGCAVTCTSGNVELSAQSQNGQVTFSIPNYGNWTLSGALLNNQATPIVIAVDTVKQYKVKLSFFAAILTVTGATAGAKLFVGNEENVFSAVVDNGSTTSAVITLTAPGTYNIWETVNNMSRMLGTIDIENDGQRYAFSVS